MQLVQSGIEPPRLNDRVQILKEVFTVSDVLWHIVPLETHGPYKSDPISVTIVLTRYDKLNKPLHM